MPSHRRLPTNAEELEKASAYLHQLEMRALAHTGLAKREANVLKLLREREEGDDRAA